MPPTDRLRRAARLARYVWNHPENADGRIAAELRLGQWAWWSATGRGPTEIDWVDGLRLRWFRDSISVRNAHLCRWLEWRDMHFVRDVLRPGDLFVDVGANVGVYTLLASRIPDVDIVAFEPGALARSRLEANCAANGAASRVRIEPVAVGAEAGAAELTTGQDVFNRVVGPGVATVPTETVRIVTLDETLGALGDRFVVVKIDAEGHDAAVLAGASRVLERRPVVIVEFNDPAVRATLEPLGYRTYAYEPTTRELRPTNWERSGTSNLLAIADLDAVVERLG